MSCCCCKDDDEPRPLIRIESGLYWSNKDRDVARIYVCDEEVYKVDLPVDRYLSRQAYNMCQDKLTEVMRKLLNDGPTEE